MFAGIARFRILKRTKSAKYSSSRVKTLDSKTLSIQIEISHPKKSSDPPNLENARSLYRFQPTAPRRNGPRNVGACSGDAELLLLGGFVILSVAKEPGRSHDNRNHIPPLSFGAAPRFFRYAANDTHLLGRVISVIIAHQGWAVQPANDTRRVIPY